MAVLSKGVFGRYEYCGVTITEVFVSFDGRKILEKIAMESESLVLLENGA